MSNNSSTRLNKSFITASNIEMLGLLEEILGEGKTVRLKIKGYSMLPFLRDGKEQVDLSRPSDQELKPGAIVLFKYKNEFVLHRIIKRNDNTLKLKGDNVFDSHEIVTTDKVIGVARKIVFNERFELNTKSVIWKMLGFFWFIVKPMNKLKWNLIRIMKKWIIIKKAAN